MVIIDSSLELNGFQMMPDEEFPTGSCSFLKHEYTMHLDSNVVMNNN